MPISPALPGTMTSSTSPSNVRRSGVTISRCRVIHQFLLFRPVGAVATAAEWPSRRRTAQPLAKRANRECDYARSDGWCRPSAALRSLRQLSRTSPHVVQSAGQEERLLGQVIDFALQDLLERGHGIADRHVGAGSSGEDLGYMERLAIEDLETARPSDRSLVLFREFVDTQD